MALTQYSYVKNLADDATQTLPAGRGWGRVMLGDNQAFAFFRTTSAGVITIVYGEGAVNSDTDGFLCIYDGGASGVVKNRLGATLELKVIFQCGDGADILNDEDSQALTAVAGWGTFALGDDQEFGAFYKESGGDTYLINCSANVVNADVDDRACIFGNNIKNRLGANLPLEYKFLTGNSRLTADNGKVVERSITGEGWGFAMIGNQADAAYVAGDPHAYIEFKYDSDGNIDIINAHNAVDFVADGFLNVYRSAAAEITILNQIGKERTVNWQFFEASNMAIADTDAHVDAWEDEDALINTEISSVFPTEADYNHSRIKRQINGGGWELLDDLGVWGGGSSPLEIDGDPDGKTLAWFDADLSDGKYEYKITHFNNGDVESPGTTVEIYIDEPVVAVNISGGASETDEHGIELSVNGDSGDDSGNASGEVYKIQAKESTQGWNEAVEYFPTGAAPWTFPFYLSSGAGLKTIQARGFDRPGQYGATASTSITYIPDTTGTTTDKDANIMLAYDVVSDDKTFSCSQTDADFPETNLQDIRLARVWRGDAISEGGGVQRDYIIQTNMGAALTIDVFFFKNHNLDSGMLDDVTVYLLGTNTAPGIWDVATWRANATYEVDLSGLVGKTMFCHRPEFHRKYWAVILQLTAVSPLAASYQPHIGRMGLIRSSDVWQPTINPDFQFNNKVEDQSFLHASDDLTIEAIDRDKRGSYRLSFKESTLADYRTMKTIFGEVGKGGDMLLLMRPSDIETGETDPGSADDWTFNPHYCQFAGDISFRGLSDDYASYDASLMEIVGGRNPYGISTS